MKKNFKNIIKLWWHCLIHFHQSIEFTTKGEATEIWCHTCGYGKSEKIRKIESGENIRIFIKSKTLQLNTDLDKLILDNFSDKTLKEQLKIKEDIITVIKKFTDWCITWE